MAGSLRRLACQVAPTCAAEFLLWIATGFPSSPAGRRTTFGEIRHHEGHARGGCVAFHHRCVRDLLRGVDPYPPNQGREGPARAPDRLPRRTARGATVSREPHLRAAVRDRGCAEFAAPGSRQRSPPAPERVRRRRLALVRPRVGACRVRRPPCRGGCAGRGAPPHRRALARGEHERARQSRARCRSCRL